MKISMVLKSSIYDCKIQISDAQGERHYLIPALDERELESENIYVDIYGDKFDLTLIPLTPNIDTWLDELEEHDWKDKLAKKAGKALFSSIDKMILRVGCRYHICGLEDGDRLNINLQNYIFGTFDRLDLLELLPMMYGFFEVSHFNTRFSPTDAFEINRKDVIKSAKALALADGFGNVLFSALFTYPFQVGRIKALSKNKKIFKTVSKFSKMSEFERNEFFEKQEKFFN